jgi:DNA/RNA-binding domain of Phe-tRNA-synthetase-like protein
MHIKVEWSQEVSQKFPELAICVGMIQNIKVKKENEQTKILKKKACEEARANYDAETLKDNPTVSGGEIDAVETFQSTTGK